MLTREQIHKMSGYSYMRGLELYDQDKVKNFRMTSDTRYDQIEAVVQDGRKVYDVVLTVEREPDKVTESYCECPSYYAYDGLCKHCVAVLLKAVEEQKTRLALAALFQDGDGMSGRQLPGRPWRQQTTVQMKELLQKQTIRQTLPILQSETCGKVRLEPILTLGPGESMAEFRIGVNKMYVLKDAFQFVQAMREHGDVSYGKKLQFVHTMESFTETSRPLADFLIKWVTRMEERQAADNALLRSLFPAVQRTRYLLLDSWGIDTLLRALGERDFLANVNAGGEKKWKQVPGEIRRQVFLRGCTDGMEVEMDAVFSCECENDLLCFLDQKVYRIPKAGMEKVQDFLRCMQELPGRRAFIQREDMPDQDTVRCKAVAVYGEKQYSVYQHHQDMELRDLWKEAQAAQLVSAYCNFYEEEKEAMVLRDADDLLHLTMTSSGIPREQLVELLSRYDRRRRFYRLRDGSFLQVEKEELGTLQEVSRALRLSEQQLMQETIAIPRYRALYLDEALHSGYSLNVQKDRRFKALVREMKTVEDNAFEVPPEQQAILREYQEYGYRWIRTLCHNGFGGILADDMGLGKTLQVISFLQAETNETAGPLRSLIVCPASLVYNWKHELEKFAPGLSVRMVTGTAAERRTMLEQVADREILITSYDLLRRDLELYQEIPFFCQIIDEAQYIKNHGTQAARAVKGIRAGFRLALTGTPVENRLSELWSIFDYLMPGYLYSYPQFREELEQPIVLQGEEETAGRLRSMIRPFILRRLKQDVLKDLPDKLEENYYADMTGEQQALYDAHVQQMRQRLEGQTEESLRTSRLQILAELTRLRQICCDPALLYDNYQGGAAKKEMVLQLICSAVEGGHMVATHKTVSTNKLNYGSCHTGCRKKQVRKLIAYHLLFSFCYAVETPFLREKV